MAKKQTVVFQAFRLYQRQSGPIFLVIQEVVNVKHGRRPVSAYNSSGVWSMFVLLVKDMEVPLSIFVDTHRTTFPRAVRITDGFWAKSPEETLEQGQVLLFHAVLEEHFVVASQTNGADVYIPRTCPVKVELVPSERLNGEYDSVEELATTQQEYLRVLSEMPSLGVKSGSEMRTNSRGSTSRYLECDLFGRRDPLPAAKLPLTERGRSQALHNAAIQYLLEEVLEQYPLPSEVGVRFIHDVKLPFNSNLPRGMRMGLKQIVQEETIIATVVGGENHGDVLLFPKTLDLTVTRALYCGVESERGLIESCQLGSLNRIALMSSLRAYTAESPIRRVTLECLTPPPLNKPDCLSLLEHTSAPRPGTSISPRTKASPDELFRKKADLSSSLSMVDGHQDPNSKRQTGPDGCPSEAPPSDHFINPEVTWDGMISTARDDSGTTPELPLKQHKYNTRCQTLSTYGNQNSDLESFERKQKMKFDTESNVVSENPSDLTPLLLPGKEGCVQETGRDPVNQQESERSCGIGSDLTKGKVVPQTSEKAATSCLSSSIPGPTFTTSGRKSIDVCASTVPKEVHELDGTPAQMQFEPQQSSRVDAENTVRFQSQDATGTVGSSAVSALSEMSCHSSTRKLHQSCSPRTIQQPEPRRKQGPPEKTSRKFTPRGNPAPSSQSSISGRVWTRDTRDGTLSDEESSHWTRAPDEVPDCAERRARKPRPRPLLLPHHINHLSHLGTSDNGVDSGLPNGPYVNWKPSSQLLGEKGELPVSYDSKSFPLHGQGFTEEVKEPVTLGGTTPIDDVLCPKPLLCFSLGPRRLFFKNDETSQFPLYRFDKDDKRTGKSATLGNCSFQTAPDGESKKLSVPGQGVQRLQSHTHVNEPGRLQFPRRGAKRMEKPTPQRPYHDEDYSAALYSDSTSRSEMCKSQGTQTDEISGKGRLQDLISPSSLIDSDRNCNYEDFYVVQLYTDMRSQFHQLQRQHETEVKLLKATIERLQDELGIIRRQKSERQFAKVSQTLDGTFRNQNTYDTWSGTSQDKPTKGSRDG